MTTTADSTSAVVTTPPLPARLSARFIVCAAAGLGQVSRSGSIPANGGDSGESPFDFPEERDESAWPDRVREDDVTDVGRRGMCLAD